MTDLNDKLKIRADNPGSFELGVTKVETVEYQQA